MSNTIGRILGLLAMGVLMLALALLLSGRWQEPQSVVELFRSPVEISARLSAKPTPLTAPATLPQKPTLLTHKEGYDIQGKVSPDGNKIAYLAIPLGTSETAARTAGGEASFPGQWELWGVDILNGATQLQISSPSPNADIPILSPDGAHVIFMVQEGEQQALVMLSVDGREQTEIVRGGKGNQPINQYIGILSPDGQEILLHIPPETGQSARLDRIHIRSRQRHTIPTDPISGEEFYAHRSWSPDGQWIIVRKYPHRPQSLAYLMRATGGSMKQIPLTQSSHWVTLLGWTDQ